MQIGRGLLNGAIPIHKTMTDPHSSCKGIQYHATKSNGGSHPPKKNNVKKLVELVRIIINYQILTSFSPCQSQFAAMQSFNMRRPCTFVGEKLMYPEISMDWKSKWLRDSHGY